MWLHHDDSFSTSSLYADLFPAVISPITIVSSTNFTIVLYRWMVLQYIGCTAEDFAHIPEGEPVLRLSAEDRRGPTSTLYGRSLRKSLIQRQRSCNSVTSLAGIMVLKAELKSKKRSLTSLSFCSKCIRVVRLWIWHLLLICSSCMQIGGNRMWLGVLE